MEQTGISIEYDSERLVANAHTPSHSLSDSHLPAAVTGMGGK